MSIERVLTAFLVIVLVLWLFGVRAVDTRSIALLAVCVLLLWMIGTDTA